MSQLSELQPRSDVFDMAKFVFAEQDKNFIMTKLTKRQQEVIEALMYYGSRKVTAQELGICLQAVHQIVLRMRKRIVRLETKYAQNDRKQ